MEQDKMKIREKDVVILRYDEDTDQTELLKAANRLSRTLNETEPKTPLLMMSKEMDLEAVPISTLEQVLDQAREFQETGTVTYEKAKETPEEQVDRLKDEFS
jgi:hypothetical protein